MEIEWLMIADAAEVVGNKLFLMGGGWDRLTVREKFPMARQIGIAFAISIPWLETNEKRPFVIKLLTEDGPTLHEVGGQLEVGRAPGIAPGADQRVQMAVTMNLTFQGPGRFVVEATVDEHTSKRVTFTVTDGTPGSKPQKSPPDPAAR